MELIKAVRVENVKLIDRLLQTDIDVNWQNDYGVTALAEESIKENINVNIVTKLINRGADVNHPTHNGYTPLFLASAKGNLDIVIELLKHGANINYKRLDGMTALMIASENNRVNIVTELCKHLSSKDVNDVDIHGNTPLCLAAQRADNVISILIKNGADINHVNNDGESALSIVIKGINGDDTFWGDGIDSEIIADKLLRYNPNIDDIELNGEQLVAYNEYTKIRAMLSRINIYPLYVSRKRFIAFWTFILVNNRLEVKLPKDIVLHVLPKYIFTP